MAPCRLIAALLTSDELVVKNLGARLAVGGDDIEGHLGPECQHSHSPQKDAAPVSDHKSHATASQKSRGKTPSD